MTLLEKKIGAVEGVWALHYAGYHNYPKLLTFKPSGVIGDSDTLKFWAISGPFLFLLDKEFLVQMIFEFWRSEFATHSLREWSFVKDRLRYILRRCGAAHPFTPYATLPSGEGADLPALLASRKDFGLELDPMIDLDVSVQPELCVNRLDRDVFNVHPQTYTASAMYFHLLNNAKIISGFVAETSEGRCLLESTYVSDINTSGNQVNAYIDHARGIEYYPDVAPGARIEGVAIYIENNAGYGHWYNQHLPSLYIVDWLERSGLDLKKVKLLFRNGFTNPDMLPALQAYGLMDKLGPDAIVDLSQLPPVVSVDQLIWPSPMWVSRTRYMPPGFKHSEYPVSPAFRHVIDKLRANILAVTPPAALPARPYIFITRKASTRRERLLNQDELLRALEPLGFYGIDMAEPDFFDKVRLMVGARVVISAQGSGLGHTAFCRPGAYVLELFNSVVRHDVWSHFATVMQLKYACMVYPAEILPDDPLHIDIDRCFYVDIDEVVANVKKIIARVTQEDAARIGD